MRFISDDLLHVHSPSNWLEVSLATADSNKDKLLQRDKASAQFEWFFLHKAERT